MKSCGSCDQYHANRFPVEDPTLVVFRKWRDHYGGIIALFPEDVDGGFCSSYEHVGQHGDASYSGVIRQTTPATPEEYADLKRELESAPYNYDLRVVKRYTPKRGKS
jgi:hypothetical protein